MSMGRGFEGALKCLRVLVETRIWDYCVLWKSRDDSSRLIDWVGCCCSGGSFGATDANDGKKEAGETTPATICKDTQFRHFRRTNACQALAQFPSSISLNSGVHGDVLISNRPVWLTSAQVSSTSNFSNELTGTRVLIPISAGIVELFATKHIPREGEVIDFVMAHCNLSEEQEFDRESELDGELNEKTNYYSVEWPDPQPLLDFKSKLEILPSVSQSSSFPSCEGSSSGSKPSNEHQYFDSYSSLVSVSRSFFNQPIHGSFESKKPMPQEDLLRQQRDVVSDYSKMLQKDEAKTGGRQEKEIYKSKNLVTERRRRNKIRDRLYTLRALVPNISKMDRASIIVDAINYIRELEENVKSLQNELIQLEHMDCQKNKHLKISPLDKKNDDTISWPLVRHDQPMFILGEEKPMEVEVEVMQINERDFLIKQFCKQKQGGVVSSIEAMDSLGLQVVDVNITTFGGMVLNIFHVEANENDIQPNRLRDSLIKLTSREIRQ